MSYEVLITPVALKMLSAITDRRVREKLRERVDGLANEPGKQGKPLTGELSGYRSARAVGQRYRIIFEVQEGKRRAVVLALGIRREGSRSDIYALARKLLRLRLL